MDLFVADSEASCDAGLYQEVSQIQEGNETSAVNTIAGEPELPAVGNDPNWRSLHVPFAWIVDEEIGNADVMDKRWLEQGNLLQQYGFTLAGRKLKFIGRGKLMFSL